MIQVQPTFRCFVSFPFAQELLAATAVSFGLQRGVTDVPFLLQKTPDFSREGFRVAYVDYPDFHVCCQDALARSHLPDVNVTEANRGKSS